MAQAVLTCPFCRAQNMSMEIFGVKRTNNPTSDNREQIRNEQGNTVFRYTYTAAGAAFCTRCGNPVGLKLQWQSETWTREDNTSNNLLNNRGATAESLGVSCSLIPFPPQNTELKHLPPEVEKAFRQAERNMDMEGCEEAAAMMYRRALETAIKKQYPAITGKNLKAKIDALEGTKFIPAAMKDWAHEIRAIGNDGAHEISGVTRPEAEAAQAFAMAFLQYCISLPEEIAQRRGKPQTPAAQNASPAQTQTK